MAHRGDERAPSVCAGERGSTIRIRDAAHSTEQSSRFRLHTTFLWACRKTAEHFYSRPQRPKGGAKVQLYSSFNLRARWGWLVNATSLPIYPRERPGTRCIGAWVEPRVGLDGCWKTRPHPDSIPDRPARSESLYRLRYPGPLHTVISLVYGVAENLRSLQLEYTLKPNLCALTL